MVSGVIRTKGEGADTFAFCAYKVLVTAVSAAAATAAAAAATATAAFAGGHGPGFINGQRTAVKFLAIELADRFIAAILHLDKAEALRPSGLAVRDDANSLNRASLGEKFAKFRFSRLKR